jgi:NAD(P)-dependent dehydrogenase (short-subunit alcohol dehydrogenase family)
LDLQLDSHVSVIIGGAHGIGRAIASAFAREGAHVALVDRDPAAMSLAGELPLSSGRRAVGIVADVTDFASMQQSAATVEAELGLCRHLVFAAGAGSGKFGFPFWNLEPADWPRVLAINLLGAVHAAQAFAPGMAVARRGTLTFLSSVAGQIGSQSDPPYSAAKAGLINFAQCAAKDLAPHDVRVNTICPGMVQTALNRSVWQAWNDRQPPESRLTYDAWSDDKIRRLTPLGRWQTPEDIAAMAVFLASPAAKNITGQTLNVDGGWVMHA